MVVMCEMMMMEWLLESTTTEIVPFFAVDSPFGTIVHIFGWKGSFWTIVVVVVEIWVEQVVEVDQYHYHSMVMLSVRFWSKNECK